MYRLLKQGYRAQDIELEPKWPLGRDAKSGKADILVKDNEGDALVIIECKDRHPLTRRIKQGGLPGLASVSMLNIIL